jgi:hypothetical protein
LAFDILYDIIKIRLWSEKLKNWFENMKSIERIPESSLERMEASEKTLLERFRDSSLKKTLIAATTISMLLAKYAPRPVYAQEAGAPPKVKVERVMGTQTVEQEKIIQEKAFQFIRDRLLKIPRQAQDEGQNWILTRRAVEVLIYDFALKMKLGFPKEKEISGYVLPEDIERALRIIKAALEIFPDWMYGNKDGKVTPEEKKKFEQQKKKIPNPAVFDVLQDIFKEHGL